MKFHFSRRDKCPGLIPVLCVATMQETSEDAHIINITTPVPNFNLRTMDRPCMMDTSAVQGYITAHELMGIEKEAAARRADAGKFLIEARMDLWDVREPQHYFDEQMEVWEKIKSDFDAIPQEKTRQAE